MTTISERAVAGLSERFRIVKRVTGTLLKLELTKEYALRFDGAIYDGKSQAAKAGQEAQKAPRMAQVTDFTTDPSGVPCQIIVPIVLERELSDTYPSEGYVGRFFLIERKKDKAYNTFVIVELEQEGAGHSELAKAGKGKKSA